MEQSVASRLRKLREEFTFDLQRFEDITYIGEFGNEVVATDCKVFDQNTRTLSGGFYVVKDNITVSGTVWFTSSVDSAFTLTEEPSTSTAPAQAFGQRKILKFTAATSRQRAVVTDFT